MSVSVGVKVTEYAVVPLSETAGFTVPSVQAKVPGTLVSPSVRLEAERLSP